VLAGARHAFDLACDPADVAAALGDLAADEPGLRLPGAFDGFELAVRAIVGQQISVSGARTLNSRLAAAFGTALDVPGAPGVSRLFPQPATLAELPAGELRAIGLTQARTRTLIALAEACAQRTLELRPGADVPTTRDALLAIPGIGPWTADYIAMRALGWPDAFLASDLVVLKVLSETRPARALARSEAWRPWRAYAVLHLWRIAA